MKMTDKELNQIKNDKSKHFHWVCNECDFPNFTDSVSESEIEQELHACIQCGGFEMHKVYVESIN